MRRLLLIALLALLPAGAAAEDEDAGAVTVTVHTERPPEGSLRRGIVPAPGWALYLGGGALVAAAATALLVRIVWSKSRR